MYKNELYSNTIKSIAKNWVVIRLSALGDVVLTTGVIHYWYTHFNWKFTIITQEGLTSIFENNPAVQNIIALNKEQLLPKHIISTALSLASQHKNYGLIDLHGTLKTRLISLLWKGPIYRYSKMSFERRLFLLTKNRLLKKRLNKWTVPQRYIYALNTLPPTPEQLTPIILLHKKEEDNVKNYLTFLESPEQKVVAIHPYATHINKAWNTNSWYNIIEHLTSEKIPWFIVGQGTPLKNIPPQNDFTNKTSIRETCALLKRAAVLVTGDSGPMHLATAIKTPVIALFGPTTKDWGFFPPGDTNIILEANIPCRPCSLHGDKKCPIQRKCMEELTPIQVMNAIKKILARQSS